MNFISNFLIVFCVLMVAVPIAVSLATVLAVFLSKIDRESPAVNAAFFIVLVAVVSFVVTFVSH